MVHVAGYGNDIVFVFIHHNTAANAAVAAGSIEWLTMGFAQNSSVVMLMQVVFVVFLQARLIETAFAFCQTARLLLSGL